MEDAGKNSIFYSKKQLPNSTTIFVLGVISIVFACFIIGSIPGIIALILSKESRKLYNSDPDSYEGYGLMNAGYILSIIGISLSALSILYWAVLILFQLNFKGFQ